ncbi:MAG: hypothetical protein HY719_07035, partial [Planctomycetes bacterium]|nr:hypothetical protein [Planctomycetota bacterium]
HRERLPFAGVAPGFRPLPPDNVWDDLTGAAITDLERRAALAPISPTPAAPPGAWLMAIGRAATISGVTLAGGAAACQALRPEQLERLALLAPPAFFLLAALLAPFLSPRAAGR